MNDMKHFSHYLSPNDIYIHHTVGTKNEKINSYAPEAHSRIEIVLLISGNVDYVINDATFHLSAGDLIILNAHELHSLRISPDYPYERICVQFSPKYIPILKNINLVSAFSDSYNYRHILPKELVAQSKAKKLIHEISETAKLDSPYKDVKLLSLIMDLIGEIGILVEQLLTTKSHLIATPKKQNELLKQVIEYINSNLTKTVSVDEMATALGISKDYLYHFFKDKMGIPLHGYIQTQKMQLAYSLIRQGHAAIYVSKYLGYEYYSTFFAQYKKVFGRSPNEHLKHPTAH